MSDRETCRYCRKPIATDLEYETIPEGGGVDLCWSPWQGCDQDAEEAIDLRDADIARLERELEHAMKQNSRLPRSSMALGDLLARHGIIKAEALDDPDGFDGYATLDALCCAFEEMMKGRDPDNLEGPPPTDEERRENARAIQALTVPERFALMFGKRLQSETDEAGDPP